MTKEQAEVIIQAKIDFDKKPIPEMGSEAFDEYRIESHALMIRGLRAMREHPSISLGVPVDPRATPATKL
jgi:hypothetical protein